MSVYRSSRMCAPRANCERCRQFRLASSDEGLMSKNRRIIFRLAIILEASSAFFFRGWGNYKNFPICPPSWGGQMGLLPLPRWGGGQTFEKCRRNDDVSDLSLLARRKNVSGKSLGACPLVPFSDAPGLYDFTDLSGEPISGNKSAGAPPKSIRLRGPPILRALLTSYAQQCDARASPSSTLY